MDQVHFRSFSITCLNIDVRKCKICFFAGMISEPANSRAGIKTRFKPQQKGGIEE